MADGSNYVIVILLDAKDKNLKKVLESAGHQVEDFTDKAEASGSRIQQAFHGAAIAMAFGKAIPFMKQSIALFNQATSAASGLQSAIRASGEDWDVAHAFLKSYTEDGLVPLTQASAALKNMLAGGYGLEESMDIMRTMKDYAAYGRQGQLSMGDAIERTTQGLKAQLSSLTDNAGWTKNLKNAWVDYAATIGTTMGKLTEAEKRTAIYVAVMKDGVAVMGDAAKASDELTGKLARQEARVRTLGEAAGESLAPGYERLLDSLGPATDGITAFAKASPEATATLLGGAGLVAGLGALFAVLTLIGTAGAIVVGVVAAIVASAGLLVKLYTDQKRATEIAREFVDAKRAEATGLRDLAREYEELESKGKRSREEEKQLRDVTDELIEKVPVLSGFTRDQAEAYGNLAAAAREAAGAQEAEADAAIEHAYKMWKVHADRLERVQRMFNEQFPTAADKTSKAALRAAARIDIARARVEELHAAVVALSSSPIPEGYWDSMTPPPGDGDGGGGGRTEAEVNAEIARVQDLIAAYGLLAEFKAEKMGIPPSLLFPPETLEEAVQQYMDYMEWIEELRDEAAERDEERDAEALERKRAALEAYYRTAKGKIDQLAKEWGDLSNVGVRALQQTADALGAALGTILSGTEDTAEKLKQIWGKQIWGSFINWLWMELGRIIARLIMAAILKSFLGGGALNYSEVALETVTQASAQSGGTILRPRRGFDYVPTLLDGGETVLSVDLTRRVERMVNDWETRRTPIAAAGQMAPEYLEEMAMGASGGGTAIFNIYAVDAKSLRDMIRNGPLGKELTQATLLNQMPGLTTG
jgi:predicted nuclease with TOPRIM domain